MRLQCLKCGSFNTSTYSKRKYFIKAAVCLIIMPLCYVEHKGLEKEVDIDQVVILGLIGTWIILGISLILGLNYLIRGILKKETSHKCNICKNKDYAYFGMRQIVPYQVFDSKK